MAAPLQLIATTPRRRHRLPDVLRSAVLCGAGAIVGILFLL